MLAISSGCSDTTRMSFAQLWLRIMRMVRGVSKDDMKRRAGEKRRERRVREGGRGCSRGARRRIIDVRAFVRALYIGRDGLLPMQFVNPDA